MKQGTVKNNSFICLEYIDDSEPTAVNLELNSPKNHLISEDTNRL